MFKRVARKALSSDLETVTLPRGSELFHGTCENFGGTPRATSAGGLLWFADNPAVAQLYICRSGGTQSFSSRHIVDYEKNDSSMMEAIRDYVGMPRELPNGRRYPNLEEIPDSPGWTDPDTEFWDQFEVEDKAEALLKEKGIEQTGYGGFSVRFHRGEMLEPGEYAPGTLYVGKTTRDMTLWKKGRGEGDLMNLQYNDFKGFSEAEDARLDGVLIDDFAQTENWGNFGHPSVGLFRHAVKDVRFDSVPARYRNWDDDLSTPEYPSKGNADFHDLMRR